MKKFNFRNIKWKKIELHELDDRMLLVNVYLTQAITLVVGLLLLLVQRRNPIGLFAAPKTADWLWWGLGLAGAVLAADVLIARMVPDEVTDDGGVNERIFGRLPLWHIAALSFTVAVCEELLFRGAIQHWIGPYWTSILFAVIHVRYLRHWLMTGLVFSISYGLGWIQLRTGSIWSTIVAHFAIDFVMGCLIHYRRDRDGKDP